MLSLRLPRGFVVISQSEPIFEDSGVISPNGAARNGLTVRKIQEALGRGDIMAPMAYFARDVRWAVNTDDRDAAPWFAEYVGRGSVLKFFEAMSCVDMTSFEILSVVEDGDLVVVLIHMGFDTPKKRHVEMDEVQIWRFEHGKVKSVELFPDTLAVANAFR